MKLQLSSMMMANSIRSCAQAPRQIDRCSTASRTTSPRPRAVPKVEQTMTSSWKVFGLLTQSVISPAWLGLRFALPTQLAWFRFVLVKYLAFCFRIVRFVVCWGAASPCHALPRLEQLRAYLALCSFACLTYILNILPRFLIFFSCVCHKKQKCLFCRFVSSRLVFVSSGPLAALVSLFYYIPNSDLRFFSKGATSFYCLQNHRLASIWKKRRNPSTNFVGLCVCVCTEFSFFLVAAAFMIIEPSHTLTHTHHHHLCSIYLFLKTLDVYLSLIWNFVFFSFMRFSFSVFSHFCVSQLCVLYFVFRISFIRLCGFVWGGTIEASRARQRAAKRGGGKTNLLFFHCN